MLEAGEEPAACALRELMEETGCTTYESPIALGSFAVDTGRLENRMHAFFARVNDPAETWRADVGVEPVFYQMSELRRAVERGEFDHALHVAILGLAAMRGLADLTLDVSAPALAHVR